MTKTKAIHELNLTGESHIDIGTTSHGNRVVGYVEVGPFRFLVELPMLEDIQRRAEETLEDHADREEGYDGCAPFCECGECVPY